MATPISTYEMHAKESMRLRDAAETDEERLLHERAWAAHFTAANHARQVLRNEATHRDLGNLASWWQTNKPRDMLLHPDTRQPVLVHEFYRAESEKHAAGALLGAERAETLHEQGHEHGRCALACRKPPDEQPADEPVAADGAGKPVADEVVEQARNLPRRAK